MVKPLSIAVLYGGTSAERAVSLRSGSAAARALGARGHHTTLVDIATETGRELDGLRCDVAFLALHGRFGEDGTIQGLLEARRIPYTGCGPASSRAAMDKLESKRLFTTHGVTTPPHRVLSHGDAPALIEQCARSLGYPVVIKPRAEGSSVGVSVHRDKGTLQTGAAEAFRCGPIAILEKFVEGREMTVGILDGRPLPIVEVRPAATFFTYAAKYEDARTQYLVNPTLDAQDARSIRNAALAAQRALGCESFSRVDLIFTPRHAASVLEVNTLPGLTERSLVPQAAAAAGIEYGELCERLAESALRRRRSTRWVAGL